MVEGLEDQNKAMSTDLAHAQDRIAALEQQVSKMDIQLLQKTAMVDELKRHERFFQKRLDAAISEVVRTKSRLRSVDSKAEAASTIAEAEIAVNAIRQRIEKTDRQQNELFAKAEQLLGRSTREFRGQNYGGALYLAVQALGQVDIANRRLQSTDDNIPVAGEIAFDPDLTLTLVKNTNLREGPDLSHRVLATLKSGTTVHAWSYKGDWLRVKTEDNMHGWVYQSLVTSR